MSTLKEYMRDNDKYVSEVAGEINKIVEDYENGDITESMQRELVSDAIELAKVRAEASTLDTKIKIEKLIDLAKLVAKLV